MFPRGVVHFWFRALWARCVRGRIAAAPRLAGHRYFKRKFADLCAQQYFRDVYKRAHRRAGVEASHSARNRGAISFDHPARIRDKCVAALCCLHSHVSRLDRHGCSRARNCCELLVRAPPRSCHKHCFQRRELWWYHRCATALASGRENRLPRCHVDGDDGYGRCSHAGRFCMDQPAPADHRFGRARDTRLISVTNARRSKEHDADDDHAAVGVLDNLGAVCARAGGTNRIYSTPNRTAGTEARSPRCRICGCTYDVHGRDRPLLPRHGCRPAQSAAGDDRITRESGGGTAGHNQTDKAAALFAACSVFGFTIGNLITLPPLIIHREFNATDFTVVMGLSTAFSGIVGALGPGLVGLVRSLSGGYAVGLTLCIALELVAAVVVLYGGKRRETSAIVI